MIGIMKNKTSWWKGSRGEWYVVGQLALMLLVFIGPRTAPGVPGWPLGDGPAWRGAAAGLIFAGGALMLAGAIRLGPGLTPLPYPKDGAGLIENGVFGIVRHPIYGGGIMLAFGWALLVRSWLTLAYAVALLVFLDVKSRREERWLLEKFPGYAAYARRVRRLIPFLY